MNWVRRLISKMGIELEDFDEVNFLALVEARPSIWDVSNDQYAKREILHEMWNDIGRIMIPNFDNYTKEKKSELRKNL